MTILPIKTRVLNPPQDDLLSAIFESVKSIPENSILAITSKVVAISQGRCVYMKTISKDDLIKQEADKYLDRDLVPGHHLIHTIKSNQLMPSAGVDESKRSGYYILLPENPKGTAQQIHSQLKQHYGTKNFGVIITDSRTIPLRRGVLGVSIAHFGFNPLKDYRDIEELQNKNYAITQANLADGLAAAAVTVMGEGNELTPLAVITDIPFVNFVISEPDPQKLYSSFEVPEDEDLYSPFLEGVPWKKR